MNRRALEGREKVLGLEHPNTLTSVKNLADVLRYQGKYEEAEAINRRALEGFEKALGPEHPSTLATVGNLASVLQDQGKYDAAEAMNRQALDGTEKARGLEHPDALRAIGNLAGVLQCQGKYKAAEATCTRTKASLPRRSRLYERALRGMEEALGTKHTSTLHTVNNLGALYKD